MILGASRHARQQLVVGIHDDFARAAVDHDELPRPNAAAGIVQTDDRRHFERTRQNRGVVGAAAGIGREPAHFRPVDLRGQRGRQFVGDQDRGLLHLPQQVAGRRDAVPQVHLEAPHQIGDIDLALPEIRVGHFVEHRAELVKHLLDRPFRVDPLAAHQIRRARHEHRVVEHQQLRVEERRQIRAGPRRNARADLDQLLPGLRPAPLEARKLLVEPRRRDVIPEDLRPLNQNDRPA